MPRPPIPHARPASAPVPDRGRWSGREIIPRRQQRPLFLDAGPKDPALLGNLPLPRHARHLRKSVRPGNKCGLIIAIFRSMEYASSAYAEQRRRPFAGAKFPRRVPEDPQPTGRYRSFGAARRTVASLTCHSWQRPVFLTLREAFDTFAAKEALALLALTLREVLCRPDARYSSCAETI